SPRQDTMPMPVIQASRGASAMSEGPHRELEDRGHLLHVGAEFGVGEFNQPERDLGVAGELAVAPDVGLGDGVARAFVQQLGRKRRPWAGGPNERRLGFLRRAKDWQGEELGKAKAGQAGGLRQGPDRHPARHQGMAGKGPLKVVDAVGTRASVWMVCWARSR